MTKWEPVLSSRNIAFSLRLKSSWKIRYKGKWTSPKCSNESTTTQVIELSTRPIRVANNLGGEKATSNFPDNQRSPKTSWTDQEFVVKIKEKKKYRENMRVLRDTFDVFGNTRPRSSPLLQKVSCFSSNETRLLFYLSPPPALSLLSIHVSVDIKM